MSSSLIWASLHHAANMSPAFGASCLWLLPQVELHDRRGDSIPEGWGCDAQGKLSTDPKKVLNGGGLVPIGGSEATGQSRADTRLQHAPDWRRFLSDCLSLPGVFCLTSGGYKGYGLGMMVEVFCGILAGAQYSSNIRTWKVTDRIANLVRVQHVFSLSLCLQQKYMSISCFWKEKTIVVTKSVNLSRLKCTTADQLTWHRHDCFKRANSVDR